MINHLLSGTIEPVMRRMSVIVTHYSTAMVSVRHILIVCFI